ncbi:hypothetical protein [Streptomyces avermitilis]|uniref:hypothetical protein n=1 Tax=Streptomyces avermitilis TaxID=33903 RepID=UPI00339F5CFB
MSKANVQRRVAAVALMAVGLAGCADEPGEGAAAVKGASSQRREPSVLVLSQDQLEQAVVDARDLPGVWVEEIGAGSQGPGNGVIFAVPRTNTQPTACAAVSAAVDGASSYAPVGSVQRTIGLKGRSAILTLVSYRSADAPRVIDELRTALRSCTGYQAGPTKATYEDVKAAGDLPQGEDGVALRLTLVMDPHDDALKVPVSVIVERHGSVVATYKAVSDDTHTPAIVPAALVHAQSKVLDVAAHSG